MKRQVAGIVLILTTLAFMQHGAWAESIVDPNDVLETQGVSPETILQTCYDQPGPNADVQNVVYKTFVRNGQPKPLHLDVYIPVNNFIPAIGPAAVLVHGGGWVGGCRRWLDQLATQMRDAGFVVFSIDYRLACSSSNNPTLPICDYRFNIPPMDVQDAIHWVRTHGGDYGAITSKVAAIGTSAGGNLVELVGDMGVAGDTKPDVVAVASGPAEMGYMSPDENQFVWSSCEKSDQQQLCTDNKTQYMGFPLDTSRDWCGDGGGDNWKAASPACNVNTLNLPPPTFISNATFELVAYQSAVDHRDALTRSGQTQTELCTVGKEDDPTDPNAHLHGTQLLDMGVKCNEHLADDVITRMVEFVSTHLP